MYQTPSDGSCLALAILDEDHTTDPALLSQSADSSRFQQRSIEFQPVAKSQQSKGNRQRLGPDELCIIRACLSRWDPEFIVA